MSAVERKPAFVSFDEVALKHNILLYAKITNEELEYCNL